MSSPLEILQKHKLPREPMIAALALVAAGMFAGTWIIGPAVSTDSARAELSEKTAALTFDEMKARPDPFPYRTATPQFDTGGTPNYAAVAKQNARAGGSDHATDGSASPWGSFGERDGGDRRPAYNYRVRDQHAPQ